MNIPECSTIGRNLGLPTIDNIWAALRNLSIKSVRSDDILCKEIKKKNIKKQTDSWFDEGYFLYRKTKNANDLLFILSTINIFKHSTF